MTPITQICLDLDEVLCDFVGPALALHGLDPAEVMARWPPGEYSIPKVVGMADADFWGPVCNAGSEFCERLSLFPWAADLLETCGRIAPVTIVTKCHDAHSAAGKVRWLTRHGIERYLIGPAKDTCAHAGSVLIDDYEANCAAFTAAGGRAIVFPRQWNSRHEHKQDPVAYVRQTLKELSNGHG